MNGHPKICVLGGCGTMGRVIVTCLLRHNDAVHITIADRVPLTRNSKFKIQNSKLGRVCYTKVDLQNHAALVRVLRNHAIIINSTSHHFNLPVMRAALAASVHYLDLGGLFHFTRRQLKLDSAFRRRNLTAILGMGCAPGIANLLARWAAQGMERVDEIHIKVGSRIFPSKNAHNQNLSTQHPVLSPSFPYALGTIREELMWKPVVYRNGRWNFEKPRTGVELFKFPPPVGTQRIFWTVHSEVATLPLSFPSLRHASFKIGFPVDLIQAALKLKNVERRTSNVECAEGAPPCDCEITLALVRGVIKGKHVTRQANCKVRSAEGHSAGDWDTAWPPAIVSCMIALGEIQSRGVFAPETVVPLDPFIKKLRLAGFVFACRQVKV